MLSEVHKNVEYAAARGADFLAVRDGVGSASLAEVRQLSASGKMAEGFPPDHILLASSGATGTRAAAPSAETSQEHSVSIQGSGCGAVYMSPGSIGGPEIVVSWKPGAGSCRVEDVSSPGQPVQSTQPGRGLLGTTD